MNSRAGQTIYVVDDDPGVLKALCRLLKAEGYEASGFSSARDFLEQYDPSCAGCLLLDVSMPGMTGPELQAFLKTRGRTVPVIYLTGHDELGDKFRQIEEGGLNILRKPVMASALFSSIEQAVRQ